MAGIGTTLSRCLPTGPERQSSWPLRTARVFISHVGIRFGACQAKLVCRTQVNEHGHPQHHAIRQANGGIH